MAADVPIKQQPPLNSCCSLWKAKYTKLAEGRVCLKQAVKILEDQLDKIQAENANLKKAAEEERVRFEAEKEAKEKEFALKVSLENEISSLMSEISSLQQKGSADIQKEDVNVLQDRVAKGEKEISKLKELLEKEKKRSVAEKKNAQEHRKGAADAWKHVKAEKDKADQQRNIAIAEGKKAEEYHLQVEALKKELTVKASLENEVSSLKFKLSSLQKKESADADDKTRDVKLLQGQMSVAEKEIRRLKQLLEREKVRADAEKKNAMAERKNAAELWKHVEEEKAKANEEKNRATTEHKKAEEYRLQLENMMKNVDQLKLALETLKTENATKFMVGKENAIAGIQVTASDVVKGQRKRKLAEVDRQMVLNENSHALWLSCLNGEERHEIEELKKQVQELLSAQSSLNLVKEEKNNAVINVKHLQKELKLEKMRLKHAKKVARFEKSRNTILQQELGRIKMDFVQMTCRLDALDRCFSPNAGSEGIDDMEKTANMKGFKVKTNLHGLEPFQTYLQNLNEPLKPNRMLANCDTIWQPSPLLPAYGGNCTESISGTDSKLESLLGGSKQKMLQSSAINSSSASFSDGRLVGSQEKGSLTQDKFKEENFSAQPTVSSMSVEVNAENHESFPSVAENNITSLHSTDVGGKFSGNDRRRRMLDAVESVQLLYSEGKKWHLQMEDQLSVLHCILNRETDRQLDSEEQKCIGGNTQGAQFAKYENARKKRKLSHKPEIIVENVNEVHDALQISSPANNSMGNLRRGRECFSKPAGSDLESMACFEKVASGDFMRLLDLDDPAEEECYKRAMEVPLSPTLPEIVFPVEAELHDLHKFEPEVDENKDGVSDGKDIREPSHSIDIIDVEFFPNQYQRVNGTSCNELQRDGDKVPVNSFDMLGIRNECFSIMEAEKSSDDLMGDSSLEDKILSTSVSGAVENELRYAQEDSPTYCVVFSNIDDSGSISRVFSATKSCISRCSLDAQTESMIQKLLHAIKMVDQISPKEKACAFLTMLLQNFSTHTLGNHGSFSKGDFLCHLNSVAGQISEALSGVETKSLLMELCLLDELLDLIEDFLISGRVMVYSNELSERSSECDSTINVLPDGLNVKLLPKSASVGQLVTGSILLVSFCAVFNHIGLICEVSFNLLQMHKCDTGIVLAVLHVFAYLVGEKFLFSEEYGLLMTVLKSVVMFLEGANRTSAASCLSVLGVNRVELHPCANCPFSREAVDIDTATSEVLQMLQSCASSGNVHQHLMELTNLSNSGLCHNDKVEHTLCHESHPAAVTQSEFLNRKGFWNLSDIFSLLELLACKMSWEWTSNKIVQELFEMLKKPMPENFAVAVIVLLGQLGRHGVVACGYDDKAVESLRCNLSSFLRWDSTVRSALPVQVATVTALLELLAFDFEKVVSGDFELPTTSSQSAVAEGIRMWFALLTKEQQVLSYSLLQTDS